MLFLDVAKPFLDSEHKHPTPLSLSLKGAMKKYLKKKLTKRMVCCDHSRTSALTYLIAGTPEWPSGCGHRDQAKGWCSATGMPLFHKISLIIIYLLV